MLNRVSVITLGGGRKVVSPKPKTVSIGKASHGGVSTCLISHRNGSVVKNRSALASRPGRKPGTTHRVGMMGTARAGGNPRTATHIRHAVGNRVISHRKVHSSFGSGIRVRGLSIAGTRSYSSRGVLGSQRSGHSGRKVQYSGVSSGKVRSYAGRLGSQLGSGRRTLYRPYLR